MESDLQNRAFLLLLGIVTLAFIWVVLPFYDAIVWAVVLAILFRPLQRWLEARLSRRKSLAAALSLLAILLLAILPVIFLLGAIVAEGARLVQRIEAAQFSAPAALAQVIDWLPAWAQDAIATAGITDLESLRARLAEAISVASQFLAAQALSVGQNTLRFAVSAGIMLYVLFFLLRDGPRIAGSIRSALPFRPEITNALVGRFTAVVRATVRGNLIIALVQGTIGGVTFWLLGIQGALLWGAVMVVLSLLPAVGAAIVWVPAAAFLFLSGDVVRGVILVAVGAGIIGVVDNILRPPLVGKETRLPDYIVLVSTVGGIAVFGLTGFVIGPMIAALFLACWTLFRDARTAERAPEP
jgi:predicted PurR-regulated permease PerM